MMIGNWPLKTRVNLMPATTLVASAGTERRAKWVANGLQTGFADMETPALQIRSAVKGMDQKKMAAAADIFRKLRGLPRRIAQAPSDAWSISLYPKKRAG